MPNKPSTAESTDLVPAITWKQHCKLRDTGSLLLYVIPKAIDQVHALAAFSKLVSRSKPHHETPLPADRNIAILVTGTTEKYFAFNEVIRALPRGNSAQEISVQHVHVDSRLDWLAVEPFGRLQDLLLDLDSAEVVILPITPDLLAKASLEAVAKLRDFTRSLGKQIVLATHADSVEDFGTIAALADDTILSDHCTPDPGYDFAWSVESTSAKAFHSDGLGKLMIQITVRNGRITFDCKRFIAPEPFNRVIWYLAAEGQERAKIANVYRLTVDEIDQRLSKMRPLQSAHVPANWHRAFEDRLDLPGLTP